MYKDNFPDKLFLMELVSILKFILFKVLLGVVVTIISIVGFAYIFKENVEKYIDDKFINPKVIMPISGTGSMDPTFPRSSKEKIIDRANDIVADVTGIVYPNGFEFRGKKFYLHKFERGDIVSIKNENVEKILIEDLGKEEKDSYFLKRIIGLPNETISLREGKVYINGAYLKEAYTKEPNSTFGGEFLKDCVEYKIPQNKFFVMGDNRKESNDSRFNLGVVDISDIKSFIPLKLQKEESLEKNYRDTSKDDSLKFSFDNSDFIRELNVKRSSQSLKVLSVNSKLAQSSLIRINDIFKNNGIDKANISFEESLNQVDYVPIVRGEIPIQGYYSDKEVIRFLESFKKSRDFIYNKDFSEIGISSKSGDINACPSYYTVLHFGGYKPPDYDKKLVDGYKDLIENLKNSRATFLKSKEIADFYSKYKSDIDDILKVFDTRLDNLEPIARKLSANVWLDKTEEEYLNIVDKKYHDELNSLIKSFNKKIDNDLN